MCIYMYYNSIMKVKTICECEYVDICKTGMKFGLVNYLAKEQISGTSPHPSLYYNEFNYL